jgi:hypothetical protein
MRLHLGDSMRNYRDLQVWTKAHNLTLELYRLSQGFPREENSMEGVKLVVR